MIFISRYKSFIGEIFLAAKDNALIGLWLEGQRHTLASLKEELVEDENYEILQRTKNWLDQYFAGKKPAISSLRLAPVGSHFAHQVWKILCTIPYGETTTYGEIAQEIAQENLQKKMSAQAVGGAVGHNPISIIIPCHRVIGANGNLTGYGGGLDKKILLLKHENVPQKHFFIPNK